MKKLLEAIDSFRTKRELGVSPDAPIPFKLNDESPEEEERVYWLEEHDPMTRISNTPKEGWIACRKLEEGGYEEI